METSADNSWELSSGQKKYLERYMGHREADKKIKDRVLGDKPVSSNI